MAKRPSTTASITARVPFFLCLSGLCLSAATAFAASFDCRLAKTPQEKAICATPELSQADDTLAAAYKSAVAQNPRRAITIKQTQRDWLLEIARRCNASSAPQPELASCMLGRYKDRIASLQDGRQHVAGITFSSASKTLHFKNIGEDTPSVTGETTGTLEASWPVADSRTPAWLAWNAAVEQTVRDVASGRTSEDDKPGRNTAWKTEWARTVDADVTGEDVSVLSLGPNLGTLVSLRVENDFMGFGAAHPGEVWTHMNWLLDKKRLITPQDIFSPGSAWKTVLVNTCMNALHRQGDSGYPPDDQLKAVQEQAPKPSNWIVDVDGITVEFPEYTVSPRVAPADPVLIPWSTLKPHLAPTFELPHEAPLK